MQQGEVRALHSSRPGGIEATGSSPVLSTGLFLEFIAKWACSSSGRAPHSHCGGKEFESPQVHMDKMDKKVILIPGWMNRAKMYGEKYDVLEIWHEKIDPEIKIETDVLIAHSIGACWALLSCGKNMASKTRLVLVNPLFPKRSVFRWIARWLKFHFKEEMKEEKEIVRGIARIFFGIRQGIRLLSHDFSEIMKKIGHENIVVVRGRGDVFFWDKHSERFFRDRNIKIVETEAGHDWHENIDKEIEKLLG
jgi:hypothetical protein